MLDIGLSKKDRKLVADALSCMLSDSYLLFIKTQGFAWNIKGDHAYSLQLLFLEQSQELMHTIHKLANRIRSLDYHVPNSLREYLHFSGLQENTQHVHEPHDMVRALILDNEFLVRRSQDVYDIANTVNDPVARYLMQDRMRVHSENAWKMRMHIE